MKTFYEKITSILCFLALMSVFIVDNVKAQTSINSIETALTENFDNLTPAGTWTNSTTPLPNWLAVGNSGGSTSTPTSFILNDGNNTTLNSLSSFGTTGEGDRALGYVPGGDNGLVSYVGWRLKNTMASTTITKVHITWTLEQWRVLSGAAQPLTIRYQISSSPITSILPGSLTSPAPILSLSSPKSNGSGVALDGNLSVNRTTATQTISNLNIPPGSEILICWGNSKAGSNHLLGIDDVSLQFTANQSIDFPALPTKTYGDASFNLSATASSNFPISFSTEPNDVISILGNSVTIKGPGTASINANQTGNTNYDAALVQSQVFYVNPSKPTVNAATSISQSGFTANWSANNGLRDASTTYTVDYSQDKDFGSYSFFDSTIKTQAISGLLSNKIYFYRIYSINDGLYSSYSQSSAITTGSDYTTDNPGNWDTQANWKENIANINIANSIKINHAITLSIARDSVTTNTLWITSTGKLTTNQKIHVTNQLIIEVDADGNSGQILNTANINVGHNATIIVRRSFTGGQWAFVGFPFNVSAANVFAAETTTPLIWGDARFPGDFTGTGDLVIREYDGAKRDRDGIIYSSGNGLNWINVNSRIFTAKKGYIIGTDQDKVVDFVVRGENKGDLFSTAELSSTVNKYTSNSFTGHHSWNLVVSPLSSAFDMALSPTNAPYYLYNGVNYDIALSNEELIISPFQSFFLQASNNTMNFASSGRRLKTKSIDTDTDVADDIYLKLSNGTKKYDDITRIRFKNGSSTNYVIGEDAAKSFGADANVSYLYSLTNNVSYAINTLPRSITSVDLQTKFAANGNYQITINNLEKIKNYSDVLLLDKSTSRYIELLDAKEYNFAVNSFTTDLNRFKIILVPSATTAVSLASVTGIRVVGNNGTATLLGIAPNSMLRVLDMSGKLIFNGYINDGESIHVPQNGLYLFHITSNNQLTKLKTLIQ